MTGIILAVAMVLSAAILGLSAIRIAELVGDYLLSLQTARRSFAHDLLGHFDRSTREVRDLLRSLSSLADRLAQPNSPTPERGGGWLPEAIEQWAQLESEPWAQAEMLGRARQLFAELDDGKSNPESIWQTVLNRLQQEEMNR